MMDTVLNLGITDEVEDGLARLSGDASFARSTHVRFVHEFGADGARRRSSTSPARTRPPRRSARRSADDTGEEVPDAIRTSSCGP